MYECVVACQEKFYTDSRFFGHLQTCPHIAPWVRQWAQRMSMQPDWPRQVGIQRG